MASLVASLLPVSILLTILCLSSLVNHGNSAVISIDFSSEWIKIALVKPGVPMEIVLNKESKRKTSAIIALRNEERTFSDAAMATAIKYPANAYQYLQFILGLEYDNPLVEKYREWFPHYNIRRDEARDTVLFQHSDDLSFTVEELVGMLLNHSRELAQDYAGVPIKNAIITVPPFYTQAQRKSLLASAQLVGLNVLQLMTDMAGVALNYGVFRRNSFNSSSTYMMFFDMGAISTSVAVVEYKKVQVKEGGTAHIEPQLTIKGLGFDQTLGGLEMDMRLRNHLAKLFTDKHKTKKPIQDSPRAMAKLLKEARRVKMVLSANADHVARIEGLHEDIDFFAKVTRTEFEEMCDDLFDRIEEPVRQALKISDITLDEIESVMLVGGGTRVPKVQEVLLKAVKKKELGKNLNTDEAPALGAVYQAASHSKLFRVKKFIVKETTPYPIQVSFDKPITDEAGNPSIKTITRTLFNAGNPYPQKKILTFNRYNEDFGFSVFYGKIDYLSKEQQSYIGPLNLTKIKLNGVSQALEDNQDGEPNGIKAHFRMDENGILLLETVQSHFEHEIKEEPSTFSKISSAFSNLFGGSEGEDNKTTTDDTNTGTDDTTGDDGGKQTVEEEPKDAEPPQKEGEENENDRQQQEVKEDEKEPTDSDNGDRGNNGDTVDDGNTGDDSDNGDNGDDGENDLEEEEDEGEEQDSDEDSNGGQEEMVDEEEEEEVIPDEDEPVTSNGSPDEETQDSNGGDEGEDSKAEDKPADNGTTDNAKPGDDTSSTGDDQTTTGTPKSSEDGVANTTTTDGGKEKKKSKKNDGPKTRTVKVNLTANVVQMDWTNLTEKELDSSVTKLKWLQKRDEDKRLNELAKNNLESHIFEFRDFMESEKAITYSTETEREEIIVSLAKAGDWLEEDGWKEETDVYKQKLRELKRVSKPLMRRIEEAAKRSQVFANFYSSINTSHGFLVHYKNISDMEILTEVELKTLADVTKESEEWLLDTEAKQNATKPYEEPVVLVSEIEEKLRKLDREIMYLVTKLRNYKPKKPKTTPVNATNATNTTSSKEEKKTTKDKDDRDDKKVDEETKDDNSEEDEEETLALPASDDEETPPPPTSSKDTKKQEL